MCSKAIMSATIDPAKCEEEVMDCVPEMNATELAELIEELGMAGDVEEEDKGKRFKLYKFVMKYLIGLGTSEGDGGEAKFVQIHRFLNAKRDKQDVEVKKEPGTEVKPSEVQLKSLGKKVKPVDILRMKDFKISGVVGGKTGKDNLKFSGLSYQIMNGRKLGYSDAVICDAVVKAIAAENPLRTYFEGKSDLSLESLLGILKSHYKEKDSTSILTELANAVQSPDESLQDFVLELMCLRDKYILLSREEGFPHDESSLAKRFFKSLLGGMRNGNMRNEIRECVKDNDVKDEKLLQLIAEAMSNETERSQKLSKKKAEVNMMDSDVEVGGEKKKVVDKKEKGNPWVQIEELKLSQQKELQTQSQHIAKLEASLSEIKEAIINQNNPANFPQAQEGGESFHPRFPGAGAYTPRFPLGQIPVPYFMPRNQRQQGHRYVQRWKCEACRTSQRRCFHCFRCGSGEHKVAECPNPAAPAGAGNE